MCNKKHLTDLDRRALLKALGAGATAFSPVGALVSGMVGGAAAEARAQTGKEPRKYLMIYLEAGPPRWHFDLPLVPAEGLGFARNPGLNNGFDGNGQPTFHNVPITTAGQKWFMPPIWAAGVPKAGGGMAPMAELFANMAVIRGYDMQSDGHVNNRIKQIYPLTGAPSLNGLVADATSATLPAVSLAPGIMSEAFFSGKGIGQLVWNPGDQQRTALQQFLDPFVYEKATLDHPVYQRRKAMDQVIENALTKMQKATEQRMPGAGGMFADRVNAKKLLNTALGDLNAIYAEKFNKYRALIKASQALDIPGVNDAPIAAANIAAGMRSTTVNFGAAAVAMENADLRSIIFPDSTVANLAEGFAVAEYLMTQKYGAAVVTTAANPSFRAITGGAEVISPYQLDDHLGGTAVSTLLFAFYYRAIAACIYELVQVLKSKDMWDETVIHIASEFSRSPRAEGTGSDHGFEANVTSLFSGAIKKPLIVGDIRVQNSASLAAVPTYNGTWGAAAPVDHDKTVGNLNIGHVSSSIADLLRVERPMKNFQPVLDVTETGVGSKLNGGPKNV